MSSQQQTSDPYQNILQHIQQEIEALKTKLMLKDSRVDHLATLLKKTQSELEATQSELESTQSQLASTQSGLKSTQSQLGTTQSELKSTQNQLGTTQTELKSTQSQLTTTRQELKSTRKYTDDLLIGAIAAFAMPTPPQGWLECNGQVVSRTTYAGLFRRIGTQFGKGNGSTTFNLPDLRGVFVRGWSNNGHRDARRTFGSYQADQMQSHTHQDSGHSHEGSVSSAGSHSHSGESDESGLHSHDVWMNSNVEKTNLNPNNPPKKNENGLPMLRSFRFGYKSFEKDYDYLEGEFNLNVLNISTEKRRLIRMGRYHQRVYNKIEEENTSLLRDIFSKYETVYEFDPDDEKNLEPSLNKTYPKFKIKYRTGTDEYYFDLGTSANGKHRHSFTTDSAGPHSHSLSISTSKASLGEPTTSGAGTVRHGSETRPQNVALLFCIKV